MLKLIIIISVVFVMLFFVKMYLDGLDLVPEKVKLKYRYQRKNFFMTASEHRFYDLLFGIIGNEYHIFPQVHLSTFLEHKVKGQKWKSAFNHINGKSVDYVLCDKVNISPVLAIELDGFSHERIDRIERDGEVERILAEAGLPLLRVKDFGNIKAAELKENILNKIS